MPTQCAVYDPDTYLFDRPVPQRLLRDTFPEPLSAAEEMMGELPIATLSRNVGQTAGPAESQVYDAEDLR